MVQRHSEHHFKNAMLFKYTSVPLMLFVFLSSGNLERYVSLVCIFPKHITKAL